MVSRRGYLSLGSGRAICQLCGEKIAKGVPQINHRANRCTASFHANAKDCGVPRSKKYIKEAGCSNCGMLLISEEFGNCLNCFTMNAETFESQRMMTTCDGCGMTEEGHMDYCSHCDMDFCDSCDHFGDFRISGVCEDSVNLVIEDSQYIARKGERRAETDLSMNAESSNTKLLGIGAGILATIFYMYFQK